MAAPRLASAPESTEPMRTICNRRCIGLGHTDLACTIGKLGFNVALVDSKLRIDLAVPSAEDGMTVLSITHSGVVLEIWRGEKAVLQWKILELVLCYRYCRQ
jgi:hypothetical protein